MTAELIAIALGLLVGLSLGALGGGGSTLAVPILVFVAGLQAQDATSASLLVVGVASAIGAWGHLRRGNVRLGAGIAFGAAGIVGSTVGTTVNRSLDEQVLLLAFSALIVFVALRMYRSAAARSAMVDAMPVADVDTPQLADRLDESGGSVATLVRAAPRRGLDLSPRGLLKLAGAATVVGMLTGLFGVGGGFAVVPALTLLLGFGAKEAIGTSLVVIAINAGIALSMRSGDLGFDWWLVGPFLATVTVGVLVGSAIAHRIAADKLTRSFAMMLGVVAVYTAVGALLS
ncbi:MAG: sulfite exporter TauE/SafE family protein [Ilumatobacter sp.]|nr:sulfite exporter TauE/SafE family protein [Ilumatobacter sp.]